LTCVKRGRAPRAMLGHLKEKTMRKTLFAALLVASTLVLGQAGQVIELKDGGKITFEKGGTMIHTDAAGNRVKMRDGTVMEAKDGSKLLMKNNAIWKQITEHGTLKPGH
jgi:hypothetical protein